MPPELSLLDTVLVSIPIFLGLIGLIRGAPVELVSCCGCLVGVLAAWLVSATPLMHGLGAPAGPAVALGSGAVAWRLTSAVAHWMGLDTRWINLGRIFDSAAGFSMGALRGVALVSAGCLAYAMILVPLGLADPAQTRFYPVFLGIGSQVTRAVMVDAATAGPEPEMVAILTAGQHQVTPPEPAVAGVAPVPGAGLTSLLRAVAPSATAATMLPPQPPAYHSDIPVRQVPAALIETHHNILHPRGVVMRHGHRS